MRLFTWHDTETELKKRRGEWPENWRKVEAYSDELVIEIQSCNNNEKNNERFLTAVFGKAYENGCIDVSFTGRQLDVIYEESDDEQTAAYNAPLFKAAFEDTFSAETLSSLPGVPIIAAHSYKGGVGRTLSLISLAKEISSKYNGKKRLLLIDADVEAPGLTWMLNQQRDSVSISYQDLLSVLYFEKINNRIIDNIVKEIEKSTITIETEQLEVEQYFLPVYREKQQILYNLSTPERIVETQNNKFIITEMLSKIGKALGVDLILIDLRAGITEYSAPFLFDPRVQKLFISSTSLQSVLGTRQILEEIDRKTAGGLLDSKIFLTMIPAEMDEDTISKAEDSLAFVIEKEMDDESIATLRQEYLIRVPFDSSFVSLGSFSDICQILNGKNLSRIMKKFAEDIFAKSESKEGKQYTPQEINETLNRLHDIAVKEITAEGNSSSNMLTTSSIREIVKDYKKEVPQLVVIGAKGSGKTYIYKQLAIEKTWENFVRTVDPSERTNAKDVLLLPLIWSVNYQNLKGAIQECIRHTDSALQNTEISLNAITQNYEKLAAETEKEHTLTEWTDIWESLMLEALGSSYSDLAQIDDYLQQINKKIVFLVDGLEDLFMELQFQKNNNWKIAVRTLCQNVMNGLRTLRYGNIGIIIFVRKDMVEDAIEINYEQFRNQYFKYELKWTPTEALRLALWIASLANPVFKRDIDILKSSREVLEERLELLWGKKLGRNDSREAISARWIIAALSDFTGQLQARDIVRFLRFSAHSLPENKLTYRDRYIMPSEIRRAIPKCSEAKLSEISTEMKAVYQILLKLKQMTDELPLTLDKISLTGEEIAKLESQGYLTRADEKYYLPEIIRSALGFKFKKGARPKVLSLLSK